MNINFLGGKKVSATYNGFTIESDQPRMAGGEESAPSPSALLIASVGTCAGFYVQFFCQKHGISMDEVKMTVLAEPDNRTGLFGKIIIDLKLKQKFPEKYIKAIKSAANACVVKKTIANSPEFIIRTGQ